MIRHRPPLAPVLVIALAAIAPTATAQPVCRQLDFRGSTYQEGCLDPCDCAITPELPLMGTFRQDTIVDFGTFVEIELTSIRFDVAPPPDFVPPSSSFRGRGVYTLIHGFAGSDHQLRMLLSVDGSPPRIFDSGPIRYQGSFAITVADHDFICYNTILHVVPQDAGLDCVPACPCEYTGDSTVDVGDLLQYLALWFEGDRLAEFNHTGEVTVEDLLAYLACWFPANGGDCTL